MIRDAFGGRCFSHHRIFCRVLVLDLLHLRAPRGDKTWLVAVRASVFIEARIMKGLFDFTNKSWTGRHVCTFQCNCSDAVASDLFVTRQYGCFEWVKLTGCGLRLGGWVQCPAPDSCISVCSVNANDGRAPADFRTLMSLVWSSTVGCFTLLVKKLTASSMSGRTLLAI